MATTNARMFQRRDTTTDATTNNLSFLLNAGEILYETDTGKFIVGDGTTRYSDLVSLDSKKIQSPNQMLAADISATTPSDKHVLVYNNSNSRYENRLLTSADLSDESGLVLLAGRSGGQIVNGGTVAGDDLTLNSTSNATKGSVFFGGDGAYDQANGEFGFGITGAMSAKVHVRTASSGSTPNADAYEAFFEGSGHSGITIGAGAGSVAGIHLGDSAGPRQGRYIYDNATDSAQIYSNNIRAAVFDSNQRQLMGGITTIRSSIGGTSTEHFYHAENAATLAPSVSLVGNATAAGSGVPSVVLGRSGGSSTGSNTVVPANSELGEIVWIAADGTDMASIAARILCKIDGTPGSNDTPGKIVLQTSNDGSAAPVDQLEVLEDGGITMKNLKSGATAGAAGAATNELWVTASHATLPDNVVMIG